MKRVRILFLLILTILARTLLWIAHYVSKEKQRASKLLSPEDFAAFLCRLMVFPLETIQDSQYCGAYSKLKQAHSEFENYPLLWLAACRKAVDYYGADAVNRVCKDNSWHWDECFY